MVSNLVRRVSALMAPHEALLIELQAAKILPPEVLEPFRSSTALAMDRRHIFFELADISK